MLRQESEYARKQASAHQQHPVTDIETKKATAGQEILEHRGYPKRDATHCATSAGQRTTAKKVPAPKIEPIQKGKRT